MVGLCVRDDVELWGNSMLDIFEGFLVGRLVDWLVGWRALSVM